MKLGEQTGRMVELEPVSLEDARKEAVEVVVPDDVTLNTLTSDWERVADRIITESGEIIKDRWPGQELPRRRQEVSAR